MKEGIARKADSLLRQRWQALARSFFFLLVDLFVGWCSRDRTAVPLVLYSRLGENAPSPGVTATPTLNIARQCAPGIRLLLFAGIAAVRMDTPFNRSVANASK